MVQFSHALNPAKYIYITSGIHKLRYSMYVNVGLKLLLLLFFPYMHNSFIIFSGYVVDATSDEEKPYLL